MEHNMTKGKIGRSLILFSLPMIGGNLLQQLYNVVDTLIVGRTLGAAALSAVGTSYTLIVLLTSIILGLCMGSGVVFAQLYGAKQQDEMKVSIVNAFGFVLIVGLALNGLAYLLLDQMIVWLRLPIEAIELTKQYLSIVLSGMLAVFIYNFIASILRSIGNTLIPLIFLAVASFVNIGLDIVLIMYFQMGVAGAALATVIAQVLAALCITIYFFKKAKHLCPERQHIRYSKPLLKQIMNHSILTATQQSIMNLGILMIQGLVNSFGFATSAAFAIVVKIDAMAYMPAQDFGNAFATFVAQNHGAKQKERIHKGYKCAMKMTISFCLLASLIVVGFARTFMEIFIESHETEIINIGIQYLRIEAACYVGIGVLFLLYGLYRGLGKAQISIVLTVISLGSRVLLAYILSAIPAINVMGIWWAVPIGWALADSYGIWYYFTKKDKLLVGV